MRYAEFSYGKHLARRVVRPYSRKIACVETLWDCRSIQVIIRKKQARSYTAEKPPAGKSLFFPGCNNLLESQNV